MRAENWVVMIVALGVAGCAEYRRQEAAEALEAALAEATAEERLAVDARAAEQCAGAVTEWRNKWALEALQGSACVRRLDPAWEQATPEGRAFVDAHFAERERLRSEWQAAGGNRGNGAWEWYQRKRSADREHWRRELERTETETPEERERRTRRELREALRQLRAVE